MGALQPGHLVLILVIVLIIFGPGKLSGIGSDLGRATRCAWSRQASRSARMSSSRGLEVGYVRDPPREPSPVTERNHLGACRGRAAREWER